MRNHARPFIAAAGAAAGALLLAASAQAAVDVGTLACNIGGGPGFIIASVRPIACTYNGPAGTERYAGTVSKFGMDIGYLNGGQLLWDVISPNGAPGPARGMLTGSYTGVTGSAAVGVGAGANVLVGGSGGSFSLQPVSVEGQSGLDVAAGVEGMNLQYQP
ncbi:MAG TPA: DUF992 domain-containing protein [Stellaceae bacterium]|nr:DUF992 domain-containing protein [Stellaceae bacterium]